MVKSHDVVVYLIDILDQRRKCFVAYTDILNAFCVAVDQYCENASGQAL